jgi:hypothetical protein
LIVDKFVDRVKECQEGSKLSYLECHADAERRMEAGEDQIFCTLCQRWKWQHELCKIAEVQEHFCFTCEIELEEYPTYFVCLKCNATYELTKGGNLVKTGYTGEE